MGIYPISSILEWYLHGILQRVLIWIPLLKPSPEPAHPPKFWREHWPYHWWGWFRDSQGRPDEYWVSLWQDAVKEAFKVKLKSIGVMATIAATMQVRYWLGYVQGGFGNFSNWIRSIATTVDNARATWNYRLVQAKNYVLGKLPHAIRHGWQTWEAIWESIKASVRGWAVSYFASTVRRAVDAWNWVLGTGRALKHWYNLTKRRLDSFLRDPMGYVLGASLTAFRSLVGIYLGILNFYNSVWLPFKTDLLEFLDHPLLWLYDQAEDFLCSIW